MGVSSFLKKTFGVFRGGASHPEFPLNPYSRKFGLEKGKPIDRYYIENFLREHAGYIRGDVLEVGDLGYSEKFGSPDCRGRYLTVAEPWDERFIAGDLNSPLSLPQAQFDCFIGVQTFQYLWNPETGVESAYRLLKAGGVFLGTMPAISQRSAYLEDPWQDHWRFNKSGVERIFRRHFGSNVKITVLGNVKVAACFLYGIPLKEMDKEDLDYTDPDFEFLITVFARK